jgi:hypothetical protein
MAKDKNKKDPPPEKDLKNQRSCSFCLHREGSQCRLNPPESITNEFPIIRQDYWCSHFKS